MQNRGIISLLGLLLVVGCGRTNVPTETASFGPEGPRSMTKRIQRDDRPDPIELSEIGAVVHGTTAATIIDTRTYANQIERSEPWQGDQQLTSVFRPQHPELPEPPAGPPNDLVAGKLNRLQRIQPLAQFPGITRSPWNPPDPTLGVGPNHVIETVNMEIAFFAKDGTMEFQQRLDSTGSPGFFEEVGGGDFCFDPKCFFDHYSNRYLVLALEVYRDIDESWITLAISDDDDPHGIWYKYRTWAVITGSGGTYWVDYPGLGFDANGYYITGNLFGLTAQDFGGVIIRSFDKTPLLEGAPAVYTDIRDANSSSAQVAHNFGNNPTPYLVSRSSGTSLRVQALNDPFNNPNLTTEFVSVPPFSSGPDAANIGGSLSSGGSRIMNVHWRDGKLWTCHSVASSTGNEVVARWYELNMGTWPNGPEPTLIHSGEIDLGEGQHSFFPAIYANNNGNVAMVFGKSASSEFASVQVTGRQSGDPTNTMATPEELVIGNSGGNGRWGDYFDIALDPTDGRTFWMVGEYMTPQGWSTTINSFTIEESIVVAGNSLNVTRGNLVQGTIGDLIASDDSDLSVTRNSSDVLSRNEFEVGAICSYENPSSMQITLEGSVFARSTVNQIIELFNYDTDNWEEIDTREATEMTDAITTVSPTGDVSRFVQPGTGSIEARVRFESVRSRQKFTSNTDQFIWTIDP